MRRGFTFIGVVLLIAALAAWLSRRGDQGPTDAAAVRPSASTPVLPTPPNVVNRARPGREGFVGSAACAPCHPTESDAYLGSHHAKALVTPSEEVVKARFDGSHFSSKLGGTTNFVLRDGAPVVVTRAAGGTSAAFPIRYGSGVWPLEQYVVATERGKLQSLGVVWDTRTPAENGNRWFHVYGSNGIAPSDTLFFTSPAQNWNHMCADCHSTWVERRYDANADRFDTRWAELSVGCEACHGPGAEHVRVAKAGSGAVPASLASARLTPSEPWQPSATGSPVPRIQNGVEVEVCAPCHSRRKPLKEGFLASDPFLDAFEPELLWPGRYHADGQVEGEVYEWASFLQSRMYQAGVRCSDCHNAHSGKLKATGNALCVRCHEVTRFDTEDHTHHALGQAPRCVDCHMPPATFMQIDERRDHSIRIPRPDHSVAFGTPNACNGCHAKESATWARDRVALWFPESQPPTHFVDALGSDRKGALAAPRTLRKLVENVNAPAIARATALDRLGHYPGPKTVATLRTALASSEQLVAYGAVLGVAKLPIQQRMPLLTSALEHRVRAVRIAAAKALAGVPTAEVQASIRLRLDRAFSEVEQSFEVSASRAETHVERSAYELARGRLKEAEASLGTALRLQPCLAEAHLNLADLARQRGDETNAERAIRSALGCSPQNAAAHHALGLWQVRAHQGKAAIASLKRAVALAPTDARFSYVLAAALDGFGERDEAIRVLEASLKLRPNDAAALQALASYLTEAGQVERARQLRQDLETLLSD